MATAAPTALQVTANTAAAVSAFNALANSIAAAQRQFSQLGSTLSGVNATASRFGGAANAIEGSFSRLTHVLSRGMDMLRAFGAGIEYVFSSIVKELDKIQGFQAIMNVTTKSTDAAAKSYEWLRKVADDLGVQFDSLTGNYAKLVASLPAGAEGLKTAELAFLGIARAARTLHSSNADVQLMFYALTQMASKGTVSMEELRRQLGEKIPGTMQIAARAVNVLPEELEKAIRKGIVSSEKFLPLLGAEFIRTFSESAEIVSTSVSAALNRLTNVWTDFVKAILDSGAGQSIANVFDAIRQKLQDPYIIERFATMVKFLGDQFADFVNNLTAEDLRKGFDSFSNGVNMLIALVEKLIGLMNWIINNGGKVGAIVGGLAGASIGAVAGPWGALVGGAVGAIGGGYAGYQLGDPGEQGAALRQQYDMSDAAVRARAEAEIARQNQFKIEMLTGPLQQFKGLDSLKGLEKLFEANRLNQKTIDDLNAILSDKSLKSDAAKNKALMDYAKFGTIMPQAGGLASVIGGNGTGGKGRGENSLEATWNRANGLSGNYSQELENLNKLYRAGRMDVDSYTEAVEGLIMKQPFATDMAREAKEAREMENRSILENWKSYDAQAMAIDRVNQAIAEEMRLAELSNEDRQIEASVMQSTNSLREVGVKLSNDQVMALREQYRLIIEINRVSAAREQFLQATVDRFQGQIDMLKGIQSALNDPTSGATLQDAQNYLVQQNPDMFKGTEEYYQYQKSLADDAFAYIEALKERDWISTDTYNRLKHQAQVKLYEEQLSAADFTFGALSTLMKSKSREAFEIGKAASVAQALISAYEAVNKAWTLPYPWNIAAAAAVGAATFANVRAIAATQMGGYASGGYTGNGPVDSVAGVVHGQEYVVNANATARHRAALEAMNAGRWTGGEGGGGQNVNVIVNAPPGSQVEQRQRQTDQGREIEITIKRVVSQDIRSGGTIADTMQSQYGLNRAAGAAR